MLGLINQMPAEAYIPWSFLFAAALLASGVDLFARRAFNPVVLCVWFFGVAFSGLVGGWGATEFAAAMVILATPHLLVCSFSAKSRSASPRSAEEQDARNARGAAPIPLETPPPHNDDEDYRLVA